MPITSKIFEAYLKCPTKCFFRSTGESPTENAYAEWFCIQNEVYHQDGINRLSEKFSQDECVSNPYMGDLKTAKWRLATNFVARARELESNIHAVERTPSEGGGKNVLFVPIRFSFTNKLTQDDKLLLAFDAFILSEMLGREVSFGRIIHGDNHSTVKIKTSSLAKRVKKIIEKIVDLTSGDALPDLVLNRHCGECEFQDRCRQKAVEKDDLSLMTSLKEKERKKFHSKGIFSVTQLSFTFRPRRRSKRMRDKRERYHHSLKALTIRDGKIHIVGNPELKINGTPVYFDVEGIPDRDFYYLIGLRVHTGDEVVRHSFWADSIDDENKIWSDFLGILSKIENPILIHYGSYETTFLKRMCDRHGQPPEDSVAGKSVRSPVNILSLIYAQVYFPGFSNGLKDTAGFLGFKWTDANPSGLKSIVWRHDWERAHDNATQERLIEYNTEDCEALSLVTQMILKICAQDKTIKTTDQNGEVGVVHADTDNFQNRGKWQVFTSPVAGFEHINSAAQWNYQRDRVYVRSGKLNKKIAMSRPKKKSTWRVEKIVIWKRSHFCPTCRIFSGVKGLVKSKTLQDVIFARRGLKLRFVKYVFQTYKCRRCGVAFGVPERFKYCRKYGWNIVAYLVYHIMDLHIHQRVVVRSFNRLFGSDVGRSSLNNLKTKAADYYADTNRQILEQIVRGELVHADETRANIKGKSAFVWVLTSFNEVYYILSESREGEIAQKLLAGFKGVLVSDFYTAYDSIDCPQQRCLIHLMRDLNDEVLNNPFDEQLKQVVTAFGGILKPMVETIDRHGLKKHFLKKHLSSVDRFYRELEKADYQSEAAIKCRDRFDRNKDKLFTFLKFDGVPWNNNNAEHAIKAFARLRDVIEGSSTEKGTQEYLTLLTVCQTCKYRGLDFLDFLRSGEKNINAFAESK